MQSGTDTPPPPVEDDWEDHCDWVEALVREHYPRGAAKILGVHRETALTIVARLDVQRGTRALIRQRRRELE